MNIGRGMRREVDEKRKRRIEKRLGDDGRKDRWERKGEKRKKNRRKSIV